MDLIVDIFLNQASSERAAIVFRVASSADDIELRLEHTI